MYPSPVTQASSRDPPRLLRLRLARARQALDRRRIYRYRPDSHRSTGKQAGQPRSKASPIQNLRSATTEMTVVGMGSTTRLTSTWRGKR